MTGEVPSTAPPITLQGLVDGYTDPHGLYDALREQGRIGWDAAGRCWLVTGHAAIRSVLSDPRFVSDPALAVDPPPGSGRRSFIADSVQRQFVFQDGPHHLRAQKAVLVELSRRADELQAPLRDAAYSLAERALERGQMDLVKDFATPFSMRAICLVLGLRVEDEAEMERLERWSTTFANVTSGYLEVELDEIRLLGDYFRRQVQGRGGTPSDDLIGAFLRDGGFDDPEDVVINCMMAFAAGRVTTQKLLGNGVPLLIPAWGQWRDVVQANPTATRRLGDELLRLVTPTRYVSRFAAEDATLVPGSVVRRGEKVVLLLQAANRDPEAFECPHALQGARQPNPHVSFGFGAHRCPGASVARIEIMIALQALFDTLYELRPHPTAPPVWEPNPNLGGYSSFRCLCW